MSFFAQLLESPRSTRLSRYVAANGFFYLANGAVLYAWPGVAQVVFQAAPFQGNEAGYLRLVGMTLAIIGWFYVMGARTGATSFGLATVVDRALVPLFLVPLALTGAVDAHVAIPFAVLDPALALGAFLIWRMEARQG